MNIAIQSETNSKVSAERFKPKVLAALKDLKDGMSLEKACKNNNLGKGSFFDTVFGDPAIETEYHRARLQKADIMAEQIIDIADDATDAHKARNQIEARKWLASKIIPETYGDRIDLNVTQSIDLKGALAEATKRVNIGTTPQLLERQVIDITATNKRSASGSQPDETNGEVEDEIDIFS